MKKELRAVISNEKLVNEALQLALGEMNATASINVFLEKLGMSIQCDRIYIFEGFRGMPVDNTFEWCAEGVASKKELLQQVPFEMVEWWYDTFEEHNHLIIENIEELKKKELFTYEFLQPQNIHSLASAPLKKGNEILGFFGIENAPEQYIQNITYLVEIVSHFIVSLLEKKKLIDKLERLSFDDHLTGVQNRHALNEYFEKNRYFENTGIIYCDVLGLKRVNDILGHYAGDELLKRASRCLQSSFRKNDIYRIGGDEFLVICKGIKEDVFHRRVQELKGKMGEFKAMMSLGAVWKHYFDNPNHVLAEADALMYKEKKEYYAANKRE